MVPQAASPEILFERRGAAALVTLNRPQALNAVTFDMIKALSRQLAEWESDPAVTRVVLTAAGARAFSAGGDLRALFDLQRAGRYAAALDYWRREYLLNAQIKRYGKPYVSLIDGIVMGGGVGISIHGSHRVAGDGFSFAMPEVGIGFFPDVGATWFLPRLPGELGLYCALTGARIGPAEAVAAGIATHRVASHRLPELLEELCGNVPVEALLAAYVESPAPGAVCAPQHTLERLFAGDSIEDILAALDAQVAEGGQDADFALAAARAIRQKSPTSLKITLAQLRRGRHLDFAACMRMEFRIVSRLLHGHDLYEGIRAVIVDKDQAPRWQPATLADVSDTDIAGFFAPQSDELVLPDDPALP
ncbi:MAG TPA: enoyl-CoA hydratase/isomerase family protein [Xanthobacteraceae bacterium]|nr:enoyl-CoA hydratase/isomerase family protein [Xanthobacteraceae bacterium]